MKSLLLQGMIKLLEKELILKVRREDIKLVKDLIPECETEYSEIMMQETKEEYKTKLIINEKDFLNNTEGGECGGVVLYV